MSWQEFWDFYLLSLLPFWEGIFGLIAKLAWPIALLFAANWFKSELRSLFGRVSKVSLSGAEFAAKDQKKNPKLAPTDLDELKPLPGRERTQAISELELELFANLNEIDEEDKLSLVVRELAQTRLDVLFLDVYRVIFGSQIRLLKFIREMGGRLTNEQLESFFNFPQIGLKPPASSREL